MNFRKYLPKVNISHVQKILGFVFVSVLIFSTGYAVGYQGYYLNSKDNINVTIQRGVPEEENLDFSLFWKVWDALESKYLIKDKLNDADMVYGAIKGMVASVGDPYTTFLTPKENKVVQEDLKGSFSGVGIQIGFKDGNLAVVAPLPDSPAIKAGIKAGDYIVGIADKEKGVDISTSGISIPEAVQTIRGPLGSIVTLSIVREGIDKVMDMDVVRGEINVPSVVVEFVGDDDNDLETGPIAHMQVYKFAGETEFEWGEAVREVLKNPETQGVIVDLRNNPGGYLQGAVDLASDFLEVGEVVVKEEHSDGTKLEYKVESIGRLRSVDVVVLVNEGSASASEIFTGALKDIKDVDVVGETTFGKGTIQEPFQVDNGAGLHITTGRWLTPDGTWVNERGITPDYEIEDNPETEVDEQLQKAIKLLIQ